MKRKRICVLTDYPVVINKMTIDAGHPMDIWNEEILNSQDVKDLLREKKIEIEIIDDATTAPG